jgi:hypothetical protein
MTSQIEAFKKKIAPFLHLWRSVIVRVGWMRLDGADRILYLHARYDCCPPREIPRTKELPSAGEFHAAEFVLPVRRIKVVFDALSTGRLKVGRRTLLLQACNQQNGKAEWKESQGYQLYMRDSEDNGFSIPMLYAELGNIGRNQPAVVDLTALGRLWTTSDTPFAGIADVMQEFFEFRKWTSGEDIYVCVSAPIPIRYESAPEYKDAHLHAFISIPQTADVRKVAVGGIARFRDGATRRQKWKIPTQHWKLVGDRQLCHLMHESKGVRETQLILQYAGQVLFSQNYPNLYNDAPNARMLMHEVFDPEFQHLKTFLAEPTPGKRDDHLAERFERGICWLLGFCGFTSFPYGKPKSMGAEIDIVAVSEEQKIVIAAECTVALPTNRDKLEKLFERSQKLRAKLGPVGYRIWPVVFTPVSRHGIPPTISEMAGKNRTGIAARETIDGLLASASNGDKQAAIEAIRSLVSTRHSKFVFGKEDDWDRDS